MKVWGLTVDHIIEAVADTNVDYNQNIVFKRKPEQDGRAVNFTLTVRSCRDIGARVSHNGRKIAALCWHGNRDFMRVVFSINPAARIKTALADYKGYDDFVEKFPSTGYQNVGSGAKPMDYQDACNCSEFKWLVCGMGHRYMVDSLDKANEYMSKLEANDPNGFVTGEYCLKKIA